MNCQREQQHHQEGGEEGVGYQDRAKLEEGIGPEVDGGEGDQVMQSKEAFGQGFQDQRAHQSGQDNDARDANDGVRQHPQGKARCALFGRWTIC